jgi:hypothetical protein
VEIEINNTPEITDDLVLIKCDHPSRRSIVQCRIRATGTPANDATIVLVNPDGRLRFPNASDTTATVNVPMSGTWVPFRITGERGSENIGDAIIEAHCNTADGPIKGTKPVTVVWFDEASITIHTPGIYTFVGNNLAPGGGQAAATFSVTARIRPENVDCSAPQITNLRMAIMQESSHYRAATNYGAPTVSWAAGAVSGDTLPAVAANVTLSAQYAASVHQPVNDGMLGASPLYDRPGLGANTIDQHSMRKAVGCQSGGAARPATSSDSPSHNDGPTFIQRFSRGATLVATVTWTRVNATRREHFRTYCVILDDAHGRFCALRQATWDLNVDSAGPAPQRATHTADGPATVTPATGPQANVVSQPTITTQTGSVTFPAKP